MDCFVAYAPRNDGGLPAGSIHPSPSSLASNPFTARAQPASFRSRVARLMLGLKRCSSRQLSCAVHLAYRKKAVGAG